MEYPNFLPLHLCMIWEKSINEINAYNGGEVECGTREVPAFSIGVIVGICAALGVDSDIYLN